MYLNTFTVYKGSLEDVRRVCMRLSVLTTLKKKKEFPNSKAAGAQITK